jgi:hypothetical protein
MGKLIYFGSAPAHDPIYGIRRKNIASRLTRNNWRTKATCRTIGGSCLYIMIQHGEIQGKGQKQGRYFVQVHLGGSISQDFRADFQKLKAALAYANGQDGSDFAEATQLATPDEYPVDRGADTYITGFTGQGRDSRSNFTIRLPGGIEDGCGKD